MIDREKVIKALTVKIQSDSEEWDTVELPIEQAEEILALLKEQPEIVRCRDCKKIGKCDVFDWNGSWPGDDWFCPDGKRRDDDG